MDYSGFLFSYILFFALMLQLGFTVLGSMIGGGLAIKLYWYWFCGDFLAINADEYPRMEKLLIAPKPGERIYSLCYPHFTGSGMTMYRTPDVDGLYYDEKLDPSSRTLGYDNFLIMIFALIGLEIAPMIVGRTRNLQRDFSRSMAVSAAITVGISIWLAS